MELKKGSYPIFAPGYWSDIQHQYPEIPSSRIEVNKLTIEIEDSLQNGPSRSMSAVTEPSMMKNMMAFHDEAQKAVSQGHSWPKIRDSTSEIQSQLRSMKFELPSDGKEAVTKKVRLAN